MTKYLSSQLGPSHSAVTLKTIVIRGQRRTLNTKSTKTGEVKAGKMTQEVVAGFGFLARNNLQSFISKSY